MNRVYSVPIVTLMLLLVVGMSASKVLAELDQQKLAITTEMFHKIDDRLKTWALKLDLCYKLSADSKLPAMRNCIQKAMNWTNAQTLLTTNMGGK
jgi:hypothetical protein